MSVTFVLSYFSVRRSLWFFSEYLVPKYLALVRGICYTRHFVVQDILLRFRHSLHTEVKVGLVVPSVSRHDIYKLHLLGYNCWQRKMMVTKKINLVNEVQFVSRYLSVSCVKQINQSIHRSIIQYKCFGFFWITLSWSHLMWYVHDRALGTHHHTDAYMVRSSQPKQALKCSVCHKNVRPYVLTCKKKRPFMSDFV